MYKGDWGDYWKDNREKNKRILEELQKIQPVSDQMGRQMEQLMKKIQAEWQKPKIMVVGGSDTGKSTVLNMLLGESILPEDFTPTTAIIIYVKHLDDRPDYVKENVLIFKRMEDGGRWQENRLADKEYSQQFLLADCTMKEFGKYVCFSEESENEAEADCAVIFAESDILKNCDLVDTPGFYSGNIDVKNIMEQTLHSADILIYTSLALQFMRDEELTHLFDYIKCLPVFENQENKMATLGNLYVLATQVDSLNAIKWADKLKKIEDVFVRRFFKRFDTDVVFAQRASISHRVYSEQTLRGRIFSFDKKADTYALPFLVDLKERLRDMAEYADIKSSRCIREMASGIANGRKRELEQIRLYLNEQEKWHEHLEKLRVDSPGYETERKKIRQFIGDSISQAKKRQSEVLDEACNKFFNVEFVKKTMNEQNFPMNAEGAKDLVAYVMAKFNDELSRWAQETTEKLMEEYVKRLNAFYGERISGSRFPKEETGINYSLAVSRVEEEVVETDGFMDGAAVVCVTANIMSFFTVSFPLTITVSFLCGIVFQIVKNKLKENKFAEQIVKGLKDEDMLCMVRGRYKQSWDEVKRFMKRMDDECYNQTVENQEEILELLRECDFNSGQLKVRISNLEQVCSEFDYLITNIIGG